MRSVFLFLFLISTATFTHAENAAEQLKKTVAQLGPAAVTAPDYKPGLVKHIMIFRYDEQLTPEQKEDVMRRFISLYEKCRRNRKPYILSIEAGTQNSGEGADHNFEQAFIVTFKSEGDRNYYVGQPVITDSRYYDPAHQAFKDFVGPLLHKPVSPTGVLVFDFNQ